MSQEIVPSFNIFEEDKENWIIDKTTGGKGNKVSVINYISRQAIPVDIEEKLTVSRDVKKTDRSLETLALKLFERFQNKDSEIFDVKKISVEEDEYVERIYDLVKISEALGLISKDEGGSYMCTYRCLGQDNMLETLLKIKIYAAAYNLEGLLFNALEEKRVLKFPEHYERGDKMTMTTLTEKILTVFFSLENIVQQKCHQLRGLDYQQVLGLLHERDEEKEKSSFLHLKVIKILKTLASCDILSRTKGEGKETLYRMKDLYYRTAATESDPWADFPVLTEAEDEDDLQEVVTNAVITDSVDLTGAPESEPLPSITFEDGYQEVVTITT